MKIWNFSIIGTGMIADFHAQAIQSLENTRLVGVCSSDPANAAKFAEKFGCQAFSNYSEMLRFDEIDIVTIATPSGNHMEPAVEAAQQGKHVLCEKPMEISLDRIDAMISAHEKSGTYLGGIFNYRYSDSVALLKKAVEEGRFGNLSFVSVHVPWWRSDEYYQSKWRGTWKLDGGGALMNQSIHMIDLLQYLAGPLSSLQASIATIGHDIEVEDTAAAVVKFKNNALGSIYGSTASFPGQFRRMEITGTKGTAILVDDAITVWQFSDQQEEDVEILNGIAGPSGGGGASDPASISYLFHKKNIAAFIAAIESGKTFEINGAEARKSVEIIRAIYTSAKEGRPYLFS